MTGCKPALALRPGTDMVWVEDQAAYRVVVEEVVGGPVPGSFRALVDAGPGRGYRSVLLPAVVRFVDRATVDRVRDDAA